MCTRTDLMISLTSSRPRAAPNLSLQLQGKMMADRVVAELNAARVRGASFPIVHCCIQAALSLNPDMRAVRFRPGSSFHVFYFSERIKSYRYFIFSQKSLVNFLAWNSAACARRCSNPEYTTVGTPSCSCTPRCPCIKGGCRVKKTNCCGSTCSS